MKKYFIYIREKQERIAKVRIKSYKEIRKIVNLGGKMSFDANVLSVKPVIREAANMNNDGGGGNLGYMQRERQEEEKEKKFLQDESIFGKKQEPDMFVSRKEIEIPEEYRFTFKKFLLKIIAKIKRALAH